MKVLVFANCQAAPVGSVMRLLSPDVSIIDCPAVHTLKASDADALNARIAGADIVVHQPIGENFGPLSSDALKASHPSKTFVSFPSIYFGGLFPQLCYLRQTEGTLKGPMGDYHDTRIIQGFLDELSPKDCLEAMSANDSAVLAPYERLWQESERREEDLDIQIMDVMASELENEPPLYTFNHPTNRLILEVGKRVLKHLGVAVDENVKPPSRPYLDNTISAVPDAIPAWLGVKWRRPHYSVDGQQLNDISLIEAFYRLYASLPSFSALCQANLSRFQLPVDVPARTAKQASLSAAANAVSSGRTSPSVYVSAALGDLGAVESAGILASYRKLVPGAHNVVECGAGVGERTAALLKALHPEQGRLVSFDPGSKPNAPLPVEDKRLAVVSAQAGVANTLSDAVGATATLAETPGQPGSVSRIDSAFEVLKLDRLDIGIFNLQGRELSALQGMGKLVEDVDWLAVEYGGQAGVLDYLADQGFVLFDSVYLFTGEPSDLHRELYDIVRTGTNSLGRQIFFARRLHLWRDYQKAFDFGQRHRRLVNTTLYAVAPGRLGAFLDAARVAASLHQGAESDRFTIPRSLF